MPSPIDFVVLSQQTNMEGWVNGEFGVKFSQQSSLWLIWNINKAEGNCEVFPINCHKVQGGFN